MSAATGMVPLEDYGLIGDGRSAALVHRLGSIDWLCLPRFDGDPVFAALLGRPEHGCWSIAPSVPLRHSTRRYLPGTAILESTFETEGGTATLTDWMIWGAPSCVLVRRVHCTGGTVPLDVELRARFDTARAFPWCRREEGRWKILLGALTLWLDGDGDDAADLRPCDDETTLRGRITLQAGQSRHFVLACCDMDHPEPPTIDAAASLHDGIASWRAWSARQQGGGEHAEAVGRSLITVKLLSSVETGALLAAPTSSLPEDIGGSRNWDYRYCWLRDASFTLTALVGSGYAEEAASWRDWLVRCVAGHPEKLQILYALDGSRRVDEWICDALPGYADSQPVRFGNAAYQQRQADVYGEVLNALYLARRHGLPPDLAVWRLERRLVDYLATCWREPGQGIWEMRSEPRAHTFSRAMTWVAVDRALRSAREFDLDAPEQRWSALAATIHDDVLRHGVDPDTGSFVQSYGERHVDASLLLLPVYGFLPADDPRVAATIARIERELTDDGLVRRYRHSHDGVAGDEGAFLACSFWLVQARCMQGRRREARELFERLLGLANDLGLLAEEYDVRRGCLCGNFPQALSHVALIAAARALDAEPATAVS